MEQNVLLDKEKLRQELEYYYTNIEPEAIAGFHLDSGQVIYCTAKYASLYGTTAEELIGQRIRDLTTPQAISASRSLAFYFDILINKPLTNMYSIVSIGRDDDHKQIYIAHGHKTNFGMKFSYHNLTIGAVNDVIYLINNLGNYNNSKKAYHPKDLSYYDKLNEEDKILMFLLTVGKSYKEIANILTKINKKEYTDTYVKGVVYSRLINVFDCQNKDELIKKFILGASVHNIPEKLMSYYSRGILSIKYDLIDSEF